MCASRLAVQFRELPDFVSVPAEWFTVRPVVWVSRAGLRWHLDLRDNLQRVLYFTGTWEPKSLAAVDEALGADGVLIDIGAHIGAYSLRLADLDGRRRIVAFEAASDSAAKLRAAARSNDRTIIVENLALGAQNGVATLSENPAFLPQDAGVRSLYAEGVAVERVRVKRLDDWLDEHFEIVRLDVVKIDVEGSELDVLNGMQKALARYRPRLVVVEWSSTLLGRAHTSTGAIAALLDSAGYVAKDGMVGHNVLFVPCTRRPARHNMNYPRMQHRT